MLSVSQLFIYPIKSLGGVSVSSAIVTKTGFKFDRKWMIVDKNNCFLTQREIPEMALLQVALKEHELTIFHKPDKSNSIKIPLQPEAKEIIRVKIFDDICEAFFVNKFADEWFSEMLSTNCRLVCMPDSSERYVDKKYAIHNEITRFTDGFPYLIIGQSSLDDLNRRLENPLSINRFRPNIVFAGGRPYEEDEMKHFTINGINFYGVKLCARCVITTINQDDAQKSKEPLKTLSSYRQKNNKIYFGQNLLADGKGILKIGDVINIIKPHGLKNSGYF